MTIRIFLSEKKREMVNEVTNNAKAVCYTGFLQEGRCLPYEREGTG